MYALTDWTAGVAPELFTFRLDGEVSAEELRAALDQYVALLNGWVKLSGPDAKVVWLVRELAGGSAEIGFAAKADTPRDAEAVRFARVRASKAADLVRRGKWNELNGFERDAMRRLVALRPSADQVKIGVGGDLVGLSAPKPLIPPLPDVAEPQAMRTSVTGRITSCSDAAVLSFTLRQAFTEVLIRCCPPASFRHSIAQWWDKQAWLLIEGRLQTFTETPQLVEITSIDELGPTEPGGWRKAFGAAPRTPGGSTASPEEMQRKLRDAE